MTVLVNDIEIPQAVTGTDMTATGWYSMVSTRDAERRVRSGFHGFDRGIRWAIRTAAWRI